MTATRGGGVHKYLGMMIDFGTKGKVKFKMDDYIKGMLDEFPKNFGSNDVALTPASSTLFENNNSRLLDNTKRELYHTFVAKRARPDIQLTVAVLSTRVKSPTNQDWLRLERFMKYLNGTRTSWESMI